MLGGYQILDLRSIDLSHGTSEASISDASVLAQLLNIRDHIQKNYDFSKPLHAQLKPLLIRYRDKKSGEKHEVACYGNIEVINTYYKFRIIANNEGEQLTINVEFEEKTDEYDNKYWDIKTAKILLTVNKVIEGDLSIDGDMEVGGDLDVTGKVSGKIAFEDIEDKDGHKRFIEGDITINEISGITQSYGKWALSGSHLLIVVGIEIENGVTISNGTQLAIVNLPDWVKEKLAILFSTAVIDRDTLAVWGDDYTSQTTSIYLNKTGANYITINLGTLTTTAIRKGRIAFDLLIDNASE